MRTTVTLDDDVYEAALSHARATGQRLGRVLSDMSRPAMCTPEERCRTPGAAGPNEGVGQAPYPRRNTLETPELYRVISLLTLRED